MTLKETFEKAVADSKLLATRPDNDTLLSLYSLYKQATDGDAPEEGPSNPFDFVGVAKHAAWAKLKGLTTDDAMSKYVALVDSKKELMVKGMIFIGTVHILRYEDSYC